MCERLKQAVLKTALPARVTGVRIPLPPPLGFHGHPEKFRRDARDPSDAGFFLSPLENQFVNAGAQIANVSDKLPSVMAILCPDRARNDLHFGN